jgi:hypothetical protein
MPDSYCCVVCGATERLVHVWDDSLEDVIVCYAHRNQINKVWDEQKLKEILEGLGVVFGEQPMDVNYSDEKFLRDCGIKHVEPWEWQAAKDDKYGNDVQQKRTKPNRKL